MNISVAYRRLVDCVWWLHPGRSKIVCLSQ